MTKPEYHSDQLRLTEKHQDYAVSEATKICY